MSNLKTLLHKTYNEQAIGYDIDYDFSKNPGGVVITFCHHTPEAYHNLFCFKRKDGGFGGLYGVAQHKQLKHRFILFKIEPDPNDHPRQDGFLKDKFNLITVIELDQLGKQWKLFKKYPNPAVVTGVQTSHEFRSQGWSTILYRILLAHYGFSLVGDEEQYVNAKRLWVNLSINPEVQVDIINIKNFQTTDKDVLTNVTLQDIHDDRIWVSNTDYERAKKMQKMTSTLELDEKTKSIIRMGENIRTIATSKTLPSSIEIVDKIDLRGSPDLTQAYNTRSKNE